MKGAPRQRLPIFWVKWTLNNIATITTYTRLPICKISIVIKISTLYVCLYYPMLFYILYLHFTCFILICWINQEMWRSSRNFKALQTFYWPVAQSVYRLSYGLDGPGSNPGGDEILRPSRPAPGAHPDSCKMGTGSFPGVKCGRDMLLTTHPLLVPRSWKSRAIPLPTLWATPSL